MTAAQVPVSLPALLPKSRKLSKITKLFLGLKAAVPCYWSKAQWLGEDIYIFHLQCSSLNGDQHPDQHLGGGKKREISD